MPRLTLYDKQTNIDVTSGVLSATTATSSTFITIGDAVTNAVVKNGKLCIAANGTHSDFFRFEDAVTNISIDANGRINVNDTVGDADHLAVIADYKTNLNLDAQGRLIVDTSGAGGSTDLKIGDSVSNANLTGGGLNISVIIGLDNVLLENGDSRLLESGDELLLG